MLPKGVQVCTPPKLSKGLIKWCVVSKMQLKMLGKYTMAYKKFNKECIKCMRIIKYKKINYRNSHVKKAYHVRTCLPGIMLPPLKKKQNSSPLMSPVPPVLDHQYMDYCQQSVSKSCSCSKLSQFVATKLLTIIPVT